MDTSTNYWREIASIPINIILSLKFDWEKWIKNKFLKSPLILHAQMCDFKVQDYGNYL